MFMTKRKNTPRVLWPIRDDLFIRFSVPEVPRGNLSQRCPKESPCLKDRAKQVATFAAHKFLDFRATKPGEGFAFQVEGWSSLLGRFSQLADEMNSFRFSRVDVDLRTEALHTFFRMVALEWRRKFKLGRSLNPVNLGSDLTPLRGGPDGARSRSRSPLTATSSRRRRPSRRVRNRRSRRRRTQSYVPVPECFLSDGAVIRD